MALVIVLTMLTMSLMLGLSGMQSSLVDERLAGNYKAATEAQMGAEKAASAGFNKEDLSSDDFETGNLEDFDGVGWDGFGVGLSVNDGGCSSPVGCKYVYVNDGGSNYIVSIGAVNGGNVAESELIFVEVDLSSGYVGPAALNFPSGLSEDADTHWPNSQRSRISGRGENGDDDYVPALTLYEGEGVYSRSDLLAEVNQGNNKTGIEEGTLEAFSGGEQDFIDNIKDLYDKYMDDDKGSGVVFHEGRMTISGNASVSGLHIVLGGEVVFNGNVDLSGVLVVLDVANLGEYKDDSSTAWDVGPVTKARFNGGGHKGTVWYDEQTVVDALEPYGFSLEGFFGGGGGSGHSGSKPKISGWQ